MSHLTYTTPAGHGQDNLKNYKYNQVVRVGDVLHISGQGSFNFPHPDGDKQEAEVC